MTLQLMNNGLDSSGGLFRKCLKWFGTKRTSGNGFGLSSAGLALFLQELGVLVFKGVCECDTVGELT